MSASVLYEILLTVRDIAVGDMSSDNVSMMTTERLAVRRAVSERTIKGYIAQARHMGANIVSFPSDGVYYWRLDNYDDISRRLNIWIDLEESSSLLNEF